MRSYGKLVTCVIPLLLLGQTFPVAAQLQKDKRPIGSSVADSDGLDQQLRAEPTEISDGTAMVAAAMQAPKDRGANVETADRSDPQAGPMRSALGQSIGTTFDGFDFDIHAGLFH